MRRPRLLLLTVTQNCKKCCFDGLERRKTGLRAKILKCLAYGNAPWGLFEI